MNSSRLRALFVKELLEVSRNRSALLPVAIVTTATCVLPFVAAVIVPALTGDRLGEDGDFSRVSQMIGAPADLGGDARIQLFLFQQFLMVFMLMPITGAMSFAAHSIIGEKQARTLEPLLATPITTAELLIAKVLGGLVPTLAIAGAGLLIYFAGIGAFAEPGVLGAMVNARTLVMVGFIGPSAALVSLQVALVISSRVNDPRTAQQFGVLIILPLTAVLVAQFTGRLWLTVPQLALIAIGLLIVWFFLTLFSVALFERESILTRWK